MQIFIRQTKRNEEAEDRDRSWKDKLHSPLMEHTNKSTLSAVKVANDFILNSTLGSAFSVEGNKSAD